jgi:hypothetical protein
MLGRTIILIVFTVSGCSALMPSAPNRMKISVPLVITEVQCELRSAVERFVASDPVNNNWIYAWAAEYTLTFDTQSTADTGISSLDWSIPFDPNPITIGNTNKFARTGQDKHVINYKLPMAEVPCIRSLDSQTASATDVGAPAGALAFDKTFKEIALAINYNGGTPPKSFSYRKQFTILSDATIKPGFKIVNLSGGVTLHGQRTNINTLDISFAKIPVEKKPDPIPVFIVGEPKGAPRATGGFNSPALDNVLRQGLQDLKKEPTEQ